MATQDARIATHEIQFSPGGTTAMVEVGRDCSKVVPISELRMDKTKTQAKRSLGFLGTKKPKGTTNVLGAEAEAAMAARKLQRERLRALRERNVPMDVMEEDENDGTASPNGKKEKSPHRPALGSLDSNSPVISWTEQLAVELESTKDPQASPAKQRPIGCSQSPLSSPKVSRKGTPLEERYGGGDKTKKTKKRGFGFGRTNRRGDSMSHDAALAVEAMQSKDPLRQSFLLRTIEKHEEEMRQANEAAAKRFALLEQQYQAQLDANTRKIEEEAKRAAAEAAAMLAQEVLGPMAARAAAAAATTGAVPEEAAAAVAEQGIQNYSDPDWVEKYMADATHEQLDAFIAANLSTAAPALTSLKKEKEAAAAKNAAAAAAAKEAAEAAESAAKAEEEELAAQIAAEEAKAAAASAVSPEAAEATEALAPSAHCWEELKTDNGDSYYYNSNTQETTWDRPAELGPAASTTAAAPRMANAVAVAMTVQNVKSKLWSLLEDGNFEDMVKSNADDDASSTEEESDGGSKSVASSVITADRSLLNLCIKSELQAGRSNLRSVPDVARSPNGTPVRKTPSAGWDQKNNLTLRLESDPNFENMREALARRFNEVGSVRSEMDSVRSDWSEATSNWTPRESD